jgi:hypothetical protein
MKARNLKMILAGCLILFWGATYCGIEGKPRKMQTIPAGTWGGQHIRIEIANGTATIEYDCANGTINGPFNLDRKGKFSLSGTHVRERPGPLRIDQPRQGQPARFTGWTDGKKMTLTVTLANDNQDLGTFELAYGNPGRIRKCR